MESVIAVEHGREQSPPDPARGGSTATRLTRLGRLFLLLSTVLPAMAVVLFTPVLPQIEMQFAAAPGAAALTRSLISAAGLAMIFGSAAAGALAGRFGIRSILLAALCANALAGFAGAFAMSLASLLASRLFVGFSAAVVQTLIVALAASSFDPTARARWMGWIAAAGTLSALSIVPLAGLIGNLDWRYLCALHLIALPLMGLAILGIRTGPSPSVSPNGHAPAVTPKLRLPGRTWLLCGLAVGTGAVTNAIPLFLPFHMAEIGEGLPSRIAMASLTNAFAGAAICFAYGAIRQRFSMSLISAAGSLAGCAGLLIASQFSAYDPILLGLFIAGLGLGVIMPNMSAMADAISPPGESGRVIGLATASFFLGGPLAQVTLEFAARGQPARTPIAILGALAMILAGAWGVAKSKLEPAPPRPEAG